MRRDNEEVKNGKIAYTPRSSCMPAGVPSFSLFVVEPVYFVQGEKKMLIACSGDQQVRHVYMDVPHTPNPKPSQWSKVRMNEWRTGGDETANWTILVGRP
jgi:hypothetical protein